MDGFNNFFQNDTTKRDLPSSEDESFCWFDFFRDAATQVDENDLLREGLGEYLATENSPPRTEICATGVAGTPVVGNSAQVFGTARLNTEPRLTFMFPSMRSAFDQQVDASELASRSDSNKLSHNVYPTSLPTVASLSVTPQILTSLHVTSPPRLSSSTVTSVTMTSVTLTSAKVTAVTMTFPPMSSATMTTIASAQKTSSMKLPPVTTVTRTSPRMTSPPMTSYSTSSNAVVTSTLFLPTNGVDSSSKSKRLSPKVSRGKHVNRSSRSPSPRLSAKRCNNRETADRSPSPRRRDGSSQRSMDTSSPTRSGAHGQSHEQTTDMTSQEKTQTSADIRDNTRLPSPGKHSRGRSPHGKSPQEQITSENSTLIKSTLEKGVIEEHLSENNSLDKYLQEHISSEHNTPENSPSEKHFLPLNGSPVYQAEDQAIDIPLLSTSEGSSRSAKKLETSRTGSISPKMTATTSTAGGQENEHSVGGKKRRRTGARSSGKSKRKKSRTMLDSKGDGRELRGRLPRRIWDGTSYKVEEVEGIDFTAELSRRTSRAGSVGRVSPNANTRLRSRKNSNVISTTDVTSDDVISTSDVINNDVISDGDVISTNDVILKPLP